MIPYGNRVSTRVGIFVKFGVRKLPGKDRGKWGGALSNGYKGVHSVPEVGSSGALWLVLGSMSVALVQDSTSPPSLSPWYPYICSLCLEKY